MLILGIETSCDDTGVSVLKIDNAEKLKILSDEISSQIKLHAKWGGVVPNLAAREHSKNIIPVLKKSLQEANVKPQDIDLITVTEGPGLIPSLLVGTNFAKTLSYLWQKPLLGIHHIEGHIYANFITNKISTSQRLNSKIKFPLLCLVVSGGHTQLILMFDHLQYKIIGETQDDAVGEAFDKVARILDLGYPGGPVISKKANEWKHRKEKVAPITRHHPPIDERNINFPRPMLNSPNFNFSFSGLKTAVLYEVKNFKENLSSNKFEKLIPQICYEFQQACIDVLIHKTMTATKKYNPKTIMLAGGVSANKELRQQLRVSIKNNPQNIITYKTPNIRYTTDNATMIAAAGYFRWKKMTSSERTRALQAWQTLQANAGLKIAS